MNYSIYQLPPEHDLLFLNHDFAQKHGGVNVDDYEKIYTGQIPNEGGVNELLEKLYTKFNCHHPEDYKGRSLSVSDLIVLEGIGTYFCDSIGFKKIN